MSKLVKPANIEDDAFRSAKWDELTSGRDFSQSDAPTLALLVSWYQVIEQCMEDIGANGGVQVAYQNDMGDIKALPQLSTMKQASAEIRQLCKQLGLDGEVRTTKVADTPLSVIQGRRRSNARRSNADAAHG